MPLTAYLMLPVVGLCGAGRSKPTSRSAVGSRFVTRSGPRLYLNNRMFRFAGANIDWLGLVSDTWRDTYYPSAYQVDDGFATVREMGGTVVRSHTLGIGVGCEKCIEPSLGRFNQEALRHIDYAIRSAGEHGIKLVIPFSEAAIVCTAEERIFPLFYSGNMCIFVRWRDSTNIRDFITNQTIIKDFERYIDVVLNHVNTYTGVAYKDDPTILAWENCNGCGLFVTMGGSESDRNSMASWVQEIGQHIKQVDDRHLYEDGSSLFMTDPPDAAQTASVDIVSQEIYPFWDRVMGASQGASLHTTTPSDVASIARKVVTDRRVFIVREFGWDVNNWKTTTELQNLLDEFLKDSNISGDMFWCLRGHSTDHGYMPVPNPAPASYTRSVPDIDSGDWWAFYYPGKATKWNTLDDMRARGQMLRAHIYAMNGVSPAPRHVIPCAPAITHLAEGRVEWRGSAGADTYSIQGGQKEDGPWTTLCDRCATDIDGCWNDPNPGTTNKWYRVIPYNLDGVAGRPSQPVRHLESPMRDR